MMNIKISEEVKKALAAGEPVIALESTIISHGMPYPKNVETALAVEKIIRDHGAVPATIGIIEGTGVVGMSPEEIEAFATQEDIDPAMLRDEVAEFEFTGVLNPGEIRDRITKPLPLLKKKSLVNRIVEFIRSHVDKYSN